MRKDTAMNEETKMKPSLKKAIEKYRSVEEGLNLFRKAVSESGYEGIEKPMIPLVDAFGTVKDKTAMCANAWHDYNKRFEKKMISHTKLESLRGSVKREGQEAMTEFMELILLYDVLNEAYMEYHKLKDAYFSVAQTFANRILVYEWLGKSGDFMNEVSKLIPESKKDEFNKTANELRSYMESFRTFGDPPFVDESDWISERRNQYIFEARRLAKDAEFKLSLVSGYINGVKEWIEKNDAKMFVPMCLRRLLDNAEYFHIIPELPNEYYQSYINEKKKNGIPVTKEEEYHAIFPTLSTVEIDPYTRLNIIKEMDDDRENKAYWRRPDNLWK